MTRVRIWTNRCRCHSSCRRSRFSASGTQILGKRSSIRSFNNNCASLAIGLLLPHSLRANLRCVPDPQLKLQLDQQTLKPACVSAGFHPDTHLSCLERPLQLLGFLAVSQSPFVGLAGFCVHKCNLLKARMIVTTYNQHVRLLSSEPFGWFAPPKFTRAWEPTLLWNHYTHNPRVAGHCANRQCS